MQFELPLRVCCSTSTRRPAPPRHGAHAALVPRPTQRGFAAFGALRRHLARHPRVRLDVRPPFGRLPALRAKRVWRPLTPRIAMASLRFSLSPRVRALVSCYLALPACRKSTADLLVAANHAGNESRHHPPHRHNGIFGPPVAAAPPALRAKRFALALRASASRPNRGPVHW